MRGLPLDPRLMWSTKLDAFIISIDRLDLCSDASFFFFVHISFGLAVLIRRISKTTKIYKKNSNFISFKLYENSLKMAYFCLIRSQNWLSAVLIIFFWDFSFILLFAIMNFYFRESHQNRGENSINNNSKRNLFLYSIGRLVDLNHPFLFMFFSSKYIFFSF